MKQEHYRRYLQEIAQKTVKVATFTSFIALIFIGFFYYLDTSDLGLSGTLLWRATGAASVLLFLIGQNFVQSPKAKILLYALMLSGIVVMMNGIAFLIFSNPQSQQKQLFAVTVGCITVWLVFVMIAFGARRYLSYIGIFLMGIFGLALYVVGTESIGYVISIYMAALFAIIIMYRQELQEREKSTYLYELEEREKKIARQRQELQNANDDLISFNYAITHDLKGPLRLAQSFTQLLERRIKAGDQQGLEEFFSHIKSSHQKIYQIIEDLLLLSRIGRSALELREIELEPMARRIWEEQIAGLNGAKEVSVSYHRLGKILADDKLLWHVLTNLVSNAIKYSAYEPAPEIEVGTYEADGNTVLYVEDNGVGFDMQFAGELGKPFKRFHSATDFEGTGIGLAIVRRIVYLHQGQFWAKGMEGEGASFFCAFPNKPKGD